MSISCKCLEEVYGDVHRQAPYCQCSPGYLLHAAVTRNLGMAVTYATVRYWFQKYRTRREIAYITYTHIHTYIQTYLRIVLDPTLFSARVFAVSEALGPRSLQEYILRQVCAQVLPVSGRIML